jgi:hypothetical protein
LNKSIEFFKDNKEFKEDDFREQVIEDEEIVSAFNDYKDYYQGEKDKELQSAFSINADAVKTEQKHFKHVLKLDKNFHIYIHGKRKFIEKGFDTARDMNYYKLFFKEES